MDERENRDDLVKRIVTQREKDGRRLTDAREKEQIAEYVKKKILPKVYEDDK